MAKEESRRFSAGIGPRQRKLNRKQKKSKAKTEAQTRSALTGSWRLSWRSAGFIRWHWKPLGGILLVYLILNIIFASGLSSLSGAVDDIKLNLEASNAENLNPLSTALDGFGTLVASGGTSGSSTGSALQTMILILVSLVIIWSLRQLSAGKKIKVKQAYYSSMTPLIPFLLVLLVLFIQLLPVLIGVPIISAILSAAFPSGGGAAVLLLTLFTIILLGWSLYMISSSLFAIYIVTLPDMHPRRALKSAKNLAAYRRWAIMRRLLFLPLFILVVMALIVIPVILWATFLVVPLFLALSVLSLLYAHTFLYSLYRELIA